MRFEIFAAVSVHIIVVSIVSLISLAGEYRRFEEHNVASLRVELEESDGLHRKVVRNVVTQIHISYCP
jgi:hypothetical protein